MFDVNVINFLQGSPEFNYFFSIIVWCGLAIAMPIVILLKILRTW